LPGDRAGLFFSKSPGFPKNKLAPRPRSLPGDRAGLSRPSPPRDGFPRAKSAESLPDSRRETLCPYI
jgi:hypothetical protein